MPQPNLQIMRIELIKFALSLIFDLSVLIAFRQPKTHLNWVCST